MRRSFFPFLALFSPAVFTPVWAQSTSVSGNLSIGVTQSQTITGISLANNSFSGGAASGTVVGTVGVTMSPAAPAFSGTLSLSGANASRFRIVSANLETNGVVPAGTYQINLVGTQPGATGSPFTQAATITGTSSIASTCPRGTAYPDGCSSAPAGTPQHPNLFASYRTRPPWNVAGVDYYVGVPPGTVSKDPSMSGSLPAGVSINGHTVIVNANNVTLSGYDFSLHGGYGIYIEGGISGTQIIDSNFLGTSQSGMLVNIGSGASNTYIAYNTMNGGGASGDIVDGELIYNQGQGVTIEYNWIYNAPQHYLSVLQGGALTYSNNLLENGGWAPGAHLNYLQWGSGGASNPLIAYNTMVQGGTPASGEGFQMYNNGTGSISNGNIANNTLITTPSGGTIAESYMIHAGSNSQYPSPATGRIHDNYIDASGAYGPFYPGLSGFTYSNNMSLPTGADF
jgi:hypothetical protein